MGFAAFSVSKSGCASGEPQLGKRGAVVIGRVACEAAEYDALDAAGRCGDFRGDGAYSDACGAVHRKAVDAGRDRRKGDRRKSMGSRKTERRAVARCQEIVLALAGRSRRDPRRESRASREADSRA